MMVMTPYSILSSKSPVNIPAGLERNQLVEFYRQMMRIRLYDERGTILARQGRIAVYYGCLGEEATIVGSVNAIAPQDWVFPYYRQSGVYMLRGAPLELLLSQLLGNQGDIALGHQSPMHYTDRKHRTVSNSSPIGTQIIQAVGAAMAAKIKPEKPSPIAVAYFGDGATSSSDFHSGCTFAGVFKAPVVLICCNNQWGISLPVVRQTAAKTLADKAIGYGFQGQVIDGNDVLAVYQATQQAVQRARENSEPQFLELKTYRLGAHSTADDPTRYRKAEELENWQRRDPINRYREFLEQQKWWDKDAEEALVESLRQEIQDALGRAEAYPSLTEKTLFEPVYAQIPISLQSQAASIQGETFTNPHDQ